MIIFSLELSRLGLKHLHLLKYNLDHLITNSRSFRKSRFEVFLDPLKAVTVGLEIPERDALGPSTGSEGELQVIVSEGKVLYSGGQDFVEEARLAEQELGYAKPEAKELCSTCQRAVFGCGRLLYRSRADHVVIGHNFELRPAVDHSLIIALH